MLDGVAKWVTVGVRVDSSGVETGMRRAAAETQEAAREMSESLGVASVRSIASFAATIAASAAVGQALGNLVSQAKEYEAGMLTIRAVSGATSEALGQAESSIRAVSLEFGTGTKAAQDAATELLKAGVSIEELGDGALRAAVVMAKATGGTYADGATIAAKATQVFRLETRDMAKVVQGASGVINSTTFSLSDYTQALQQGGAAARSAGLSFEDFNALLALTATALGTTGSDTGTSAKTFLSRLVPQSKEAADMMRQLGLVFYDANGKFVGLSETAQRLQNALSGLSDEQRNLALVTLFGADAQRQAIALMEGGADGVAKYRQSVLDAGNANEQAKIQMEGFTGATNNLSAAFDNLGAAISKSKIFELLTEFANFSAKGVNSVAVGIDAINKNGLAVFSDPAVNDLAQDGRKRTKQWTLGTNAAAAEAVQAMTPSELKAFLEKPLNNPYGNLKNRKDTYLGKKIYDEAVKKAAEDANSGNRGAYIKGSYSRGGGLSKETTPPREFGASEIGDIVIKKISKSLSESDLKVKVPDDFIQSTELMRQNSEELLKTALAMEEAMRPITDIVDDVKSELEYAIVRKDWSNIGDAFTDALRRVLYQSVMKDLVDSFGDMLEQVFAMVFQRLSRSQSKGFDDALGGVFDAVVGGVSTLIGGSNAAIGASALKTGAQALHVTVNAQDAVLTSTVKGWVTQGASAAINHSRGIVPADTARANMQRLR